MRRALKWIVAFLAINTVVWGVGQLVTRAKSSDDLASDDLEVYTFWFGKEIVSRSQQLRTIRSRVLMGGATIDLREANPSPEGLVVDVSTRLGGTALLVRKDWDVRVDEHTESAAVEIKLDTDAAATSDAPVVHVTLRTKYGGALVGYELPAEAHAKPA